MSALHLCEVLPSVLGSSVEKKEDAPSGMGPPLPTRVPALTAQNANTRAALLRISRFLGLNRTGRIRRKTTWFLWPFRRGFPSPFLDGSSTSVSSFLLLSFEKLKPGVEVVGQKVARLLSRFGVRSRYVGTVGT